MAEHGTSRLWLARGVFVLIALVLIYIQLLPMNTTPSAWAPPDLLLAVTLAWVVRRPDYLPVVLIAGVFLLADFLFQRPPGLWTALVVVLTEALRAQAKSLRTASFPMEWATVSAGVVALMVAYRVTNSAMMLPQAPLMLTLIQMLLTILIDPVVVLLSHLFFGVRRPAPGEIDAAGRRL